jgi:hydroxymethylglutaryl-CoA lyase
VLAAAPRPPGVSYIGLVLNERGFERAAAARCHEITYVVVASESFSLRNNGATIAQSVAGWRRVARAARAANLPTTAIVAASFGCPFEGEIPADRVLRLAAELLEEDPAEIAFADTIGCGAPNQTVALIEGARRLSPTVRVRCHFHDTRNTGVANAIAAVGAGAHALDAAIGGTGGCPFAPAATGNVATEDLVYVLHRMGVETGLEQSALIDAARWLAGVLGKPVASAVARAGSFPQA